MSTPGIARFPSPAARRRAKRLLLKMFGLYLLILIAVGAVVGLIAQSVIAALMAVVVAMGVMPFIATGLRVRYQRRHPRKPS